MSLKKRPLYRKRGKWSSTQENNPAENERDMLHTLLSPGPYIPTLTNVDDGNLLRFTDKDKYFFEKLLDLLLEPAY